MKVIELEKKEIDIKDFKLRSAQDSDYKTLYREDTVLMSEGKIKVIYQRLDLDSTKIVEALETIKYQEGFRSRGLKSRSRIFGYAPRLEFRQDFCHAASLAMEQPKEHQIVCDYAKQVTQIYEKIDPQMFKRHDKMSKKILKDYQIEDTPFTSGIINKNNPLKYHFDFGNFVDVYSCMLGFKKNIVGGYLSLPEYECAFEISHNSVFIFDGQNILHGVTPFEKLTEDAYRYTIVYYSLKRMWECLPISEEVIRIRNKRLGMEQRRARGELAPAILAKMKQVEKRKAKEKESLGDNVR